MSDAHVLIAPGAVWFAQNSDREPGEPQPVVRLPGRTVLVKGDPQLHQEKFDLA